MALPSVAEAMLRVLLAELNKAKVFNFVPKKKCPNFSKTNPDNYRDKNWLIDLKTNIKLTQIKAALAVNSSLIQIYWELGKQTVENIPSTISYC